MNALSEMADEIEAWAQWWGQPLMLAAPIRLAERLLDRGYTKTDDGAGTPPDGKPERANSIPAPSSPAPRRFQLYRRHDVTGISGTGVVAEGTEYRDGVTSLRWYGDHPSEVWWPSVAEILAVHGHEGATEVRWLDEPPIDYWPAEGGRDAN